MIHGLLLLIWWWDHQLRHCHCRCHCHHHHCRLQYLPLHWSPRRRVECMNSQCHCSCLLFLESLSRSLPVLVKTHLPSYLFCRSIFHFSFSWWLIILATKKYGDIFISYNSKLLYYYMVINSFPPCTFQFSCMSSYLSCMYAVSIYHVCMFMHAYMHDDQLLWWMEKKK